MSFKTSIKSSLKLITRIFEYFFNPRPNTVNDLTKGAQKWIYRRELTFTFTTILIRAIPSLFLAAIILKLITMIAMALSFDIHDIDKLCEFDSTVLKILRDLILGIMTVGLVIILKYFFGADKDDKEERKDIIEGIKNIVEEKK